MENYEGIRPGTPMTDKELRQFDRDLKREDRRRQQEYVSKQPDQSKTIIAVGKIEGNKTTLVVPGHPQPEQKRIAVSGKIKHGVTTIVAEKLKAA